ncbi:MAG: class I SAM-dependent rRNA methyltransferase [candidate division KSB1 bacterium]|nr:class I SAM-dependent rRNA methyltransferase [candidate division KSB1 bacterium]
MATLVLNAQGEARVKGGHPWVMARDVAKIRGQVHDGDVVAVADRRGGHLGMAIANTRSRILARIYTRDQRPLDRSLLAERLQKAIAYRKDLLGLGPEGGVRWVFSESDGLPGLIVDQYGPCVVLQLLTLAMDQRRQILLEVLDELLSPEIICERSDVPARQAEGLPEVRQVWKGELAGPVEIIESGVHYLVDPLGGQKTGFFLDQRDNRLLLRSVSSGKRVLDAFCYTGGFAVAAAAAGAREVLGIDSSGPALELAQANARRNGVADRCQFVDADVFEKLRELEAAGSRFDLIVLDPPAFAKSRESVKSAYRGYKEINLRSMRLLAPVGVLVTCSCSHHMTEELFQQMLNEAARDCGLRLRLLRKTTQALDHPILLGMPESQYLKCFWVTIAEE